MPRRPPCRSKGAAARARPSPIGRRRPSAPSSSPASSMPASIPSPSSRWRHSRTWATRSTSLLPTTICRRPALPAMRRRSAAWLSVAARSRSTAFGTMTTTSTCSKTRSSSTITTPPRACDWRARPGRASWSSSTASMPASPPRERRARSMTGSAARSNSSARRDTRSCSRASTTIRSARASIRSAARSPTPTTTAGPGSTPPRPPL